jgi:hypothetical protein
VKRSRALIVNITDTQAEIDASDLVLERVAPGCPVQRTKDALALASRSSAFDQALIASSRSGFARIYLPAEPKAIN